MSADDGERERITRVFGELLYATGSFLSGVPYDERTEEHQRMFAAHSAACKLLWGPDGIAGPLPGSAHPRTASVQGEP